MSLSTATVNLARTRADLKGRIIDAANAIDAGDVNALNKFAGRMEDRQGIGRWRWDKDFSLKGTGRTYRTRSEY